MTSTRGPGPSAMLVSVDPGAHDHVARESPQGSRQVALAVPPSEQVRSEKQSALLEQVLPMLPPQLWARSTRKSQLGHTVRDDSNPKSHRSRAGPSQTGPVPPSQAGDGVDDSAHVAPASLCTHVRLAQSRRCQRMGATWSITEGHVTNVLPSQESGLRARAHSSRQLDEARPIINSRQVRIIVDV